MRALVSAATLLGATVHLPAVSAAAPSPPSAVGCWQTTDQQTHEPASVVEIAADASGRLVGHIAKILRRDQPRPRRCERCPGALRGQPMLGLRILWDLAGDDGTWEGGQVLDPINGKIYRCRLLLRPGGNALEVRGFIGAAVFGRSQIWHRTACDA